MPLQEDDLSQFTGTDNWYRHWMGFTYTDGVKYVADEADAYWLLDAIGSYQKEKMVAGNRRLQEFQLWELNVEDHKGILTLREDSGQPIVVEQHIEYTDFPLAYIKLYLEGGVLLLPSEH